MRVEMANSMATSIGSVQVPLGLVELVLADDRFSMEISCGSMRCSEHRSARRHNRCKAHETAGPDDVVINCFHSAAHQIGLVPEAGSAGVAEKTLPPLSVRLRPGPR